MKAYINELLKRTDLIKYLVVSGLKSQNKNSYLGFFWWLLDPLLQVVIYYFVVVIIFQRARGADYGIYLATGLIECRWMATSISTATRSIISQSGIITQVYLPKVTFPLCTVLSQMINFGFGLIVIALCFVFFQIKPGLANIWLPFVISIQFLFLLALSMMIAYLSVFIRDMELLVTHLLRLWFYGSPVIWYADMVPERVSWIIHINPATIFLMSYRSIMINNAAPDVMALTLIGFLSSISIFLLLYLYTNYEHKIIKAL